MVRGVRALVFEFSSLVFVCVTVSRLRHRPTRRSNSNAQLHTSTFSNINTRTPRLEHRYKDEGGKDKTMSVAFNLVDVDGELVNTKTNRDIKDLAVSFSLVYVVFENVTLKTLLNQLSNNKLD